MKKIVMLSSSPRKMGNSDILCQQFKKGAEEIDELKKLTPPITQIFLELCGKSLIKIHSFACKCEYCSGYGYHF
jgi:hypothetical protein